MGGTALILVIAVPAAFISVMYVLAMPLSFIIAALGVYWMIYGLYAASRIWW